MDDGISSHFPGHCLENSGIVRRIGVNIGCGMMTEGLVSHLDQNGLRSAIGNRKMPHESVTMVSWGIRNRYSMFQIQQRRAMKVKKLAD